MYDTTVTVGGIEDAGLVGGQHWIPDRRRAGKTTRPASKQRALNDGPQPGDRWQARYFRVRHDLRDQVRGHRDTREQITAKPATLIVSELPRDRASPASGPA
jgi:hypothetical protein